MLKNHIKRSLASATAVGAVLAVAATTTPTVVTSAPEIRNVACDQGYENPVQTFVQLNLDPGNMVRFGQQVKAVATLQGESPRGSFRLSAGGWAATVTKAEAAAGVRLPALGAGNTYEVRATFRPTCSDGQYAKGSSSKQLTVYRALTDVSSRAGDRERGQRPAVAGVVSSTRSPGGDVRVTITNGTASKSQTVALDRQGGGESTFRAVFGSTRKLGTWDVSVRYLGASNFKRSSDSTSFRITR